MEFTSTVLMVLGIYIGIPIALVLAIGGGYALTRKLAPRAKTVKAKKATGELLIESKASEDSWDLGLEA